MKKIFVAILCSTLVLSISAREKTIFTPYYKYNGAGFTVQRIVMNDTVTVLHCKVQQSLMSDWSISEKSILKANGKEYTLRSAERFICPKDSAARRATFHLGDLTNATVHTLGDRKHYNADSLILFFTPLPAKTKAFDFTEGNGPSDWRFYGLRTDNKPWPVSKLLRAVNTENEITTLPDFVCKEKGVAILEGHLYGAEGINGLDIDVPPFNNFDGTPAVKCNIDSSGNYRVEISTYRPRIIFLNLPPFRNYQHKICIMMVPNETQHLDWDMLAAEKAKHDIKDDKIDINQFFTVSGRYAPLTRAANLYPDIFNFSMDAKDKSSVEHYITNCRELLHKKVEAIKQDKRLTPVQRDYLTMDLQWHYLFELSKYNGRLKHLVQIYQDRKDTIKTALYTEEKKHFSWTTPATDHFIYGRDGRSFFTNTDIPEYMEALGLTSNHYYTWVKNYLEAGARVEKILKFFPITDEKEWAKIAPMFCPELQALNDSIKEKMTQLHYDPSKIRIQDFSNVAADEVLNRIKSTYKGSVVLIDCWATWCAPCRMGIKAMQPLEREMEGKKVVFVYITDESSPLEGWKQTINTMPGDHIRLTNEQFSKLPNTESIPAYLILDQEGNEILKQLGWSDGNIDLFRNAISKALH